MEIGWGWNGGWEIRSRNVWFVKFKRVKKIVRKSRLKWKGI